ncbi:MAG: diguanylate cyclase domain-containing protein [Plesiomonas shigelloides]
MTLSHDINPEYTQYYHHARDHQLLRSSKIIFFLSTFAAYFIAWHISAQLNLSIWGYSIYTLLSVFILAGLLFGLMGTKLLPEPVHAPFYATVCAIGSGLLTLIAAPLLVKVYPDHILQLGVLSSSLLAVMFFSIYPLACYALLLPALFSSLFFFSDAGSSGITQALLLIVLLPMLQWQLQHWFKRAIRHQFDKEQLRKDLDIAGLLDPVCGLKNRKFFDQALEVELAAGRRNSTPLSLLLISLNNTKQYEYTFGKYAVGQLLERAAECLRRALYRPRDTAIRYGYNEFVIMLPETMLSGSTIVEQRVLQQVDNLGLMGVGQPTDNSVHFSIRTLELPPKTHRNEARHAINSAFAELREQELNALNIPASE